MIARLEHRALLTTTFSATNDLLETAQAIVVATDEVELALEGPADVKSRQKQTIVKGTSTGGHVIITTDSGSGGGIVSIYDPA